MRAAIVLCIFLTYHSLQAQDFELTSINLTVQDGLAGDNVYCALQDDKGYIWFGTETGVSRYNGRVFENFYMSDGLGDNEIFRIDQDSRGRIWFSGFNGKFSYYHHGKFYNAQNDSTLAKMKVSTFYLNVFEDSQGRVWFSDRDQVVMLDTLDQVRIWEKQTIEGALLNAFKEVNGQVLGLSVRTNSELTFADGKEFDFSISHFDPSDSLNLFSAYLSGQQTYLTQFDRRVSEYYLNRYISEEIPGSSINKLHHYDPEIIWACTYNGAFRINKNTGEFRRFFEREIVTHVLKDREEGYWFTTLGKGVYYTPSLNHESVSEFEKKPMDMVSSLLAHKGRIFFGGVGASFGSIDNGKITMATDKGFVGRALTRGILPWLDGDEMLVHAESFIIQYNGLKMKSVTPLSVKAVKKWDHDLYAISSGWSLMVIDEKNLETVLSMPRGELMDRRILKEMNDYLKYLNLSTGFIADIEQQGDSLLLGTTKGLFSLNKALEYKKLSGHPVMDQRINDIINLGGGDYALATHGFGTFIYRQGRWIKASVKEGLASDISRKIWAGNPDTLWVATNGGVSRIVVDEPPQIANITKSDGLLSEEVHDLLLQDGALYAANSRGISKIDIKDWETETVAPLVNLRPLEADGQVVQGDSLELKYNTGNIVLNFDGIHFRSLDRIRYEYRTLGLDDQWKPSANNAISFGALASGRYTFQVRTRSAFGNYSEVAQVTFTILTPFWLTWWFLLLVSLVVVALVWWLVKTIIKRNKRKAQKEFDFELRMADAERKALQSQLNPHFIFNSLNSIQAMVLEKNPEEAYSYLEKFSKLIRRILEFSEKSMVSLKDELETLRLYIDLENLRLDGKFAYEINVATGVSLIREIPSLITQPYVENSIWHGVMPLETRTGKIDINVHLDSGELVIDIIDNGVGRKQSGEGMGTRIVSELVRKFQGDQSGEVEVQDLFDGEKSVGTKVSIRILEAVYG